MSSLLADLILAEKENFKFVAVTFAPYSTTGNKYYYKTLLDIEEGDFVAVTTPGNKHQVVQVEEVLDYTEADIDEKITYKWVVQKIDFTAYEQVVEMEANLSKQLKTAERRRRLTEMKEDALSFLSDDERKGLVRL